MDEVDLAVDAVCRLPIDYQQFGDRSAVDLVRRSGIGRYLAELTVDRIASCLDRHPDWIDSWYGWNEDIRGTPAWYVVAERDGFEVGYVERGGARSRREHFDDRLRACATYVRHAVQDLAQLV